MDCNQVPTKKRTKQKEPGGEGNAFDVLMQSKKGRMSTSPGSTSRFVECPLGCGSHVLQSVINSHLDNCISGCDSGVRCERQAPHKPGDRAQVRETPECATQVDSPAPSHTTTNSALNRSMHTPADEPKRWHVFSTMMEESRRVFANDNLPPIKCRFHLRNSYQTSFVDTDTDFGKGDCMASQCEWSATVLLRGSRMQYSTDTHPSASRPLPRDVELTVSSAIPSAPTSTARRRLVRNHSRLSIPVLKSILQKSVRRRRPLPAARVAMELMDKALGELLRRLPIIILEDSTLHTDFPLIVWLMVAESKDFALPPEMILKVLRVIYETAACPWADYLYCDEVGIEEPEGSQEPISGASFGRNDLPLNCNDLLRSMLIRMSYGGMKGDIAMLHGCMRVWSRRFQQRELSQHLREKLSGKPGDTWMDVPGIVQARAQAQSESKLKPFVAMGVEKLTAADLCVSGIDFHCSPVLDHLVSDLSFVTKSCDLLSGMQTNSDSLFSLSQRRSWLLSVLKSCMWDFSSGVNFRLPLLESEPDTARSKDKRDLETFWRDHVSKRVDLYANKYVIDRLAG